ncbi:MAG: hypothetical protein HC780_09230 [Leptolyngbyaceae cyanobacterium CSU_1_3]|nr:hypothetical protein [Leptolyngbyaceae cyanobacterium CSU_1_3]
MQSLDLSISHLESVCGVATFDLNGLPKEYFVVEDNPNTNWIQATFQVLGLRSLFSTLLAEGFDHAAIRGQGYSVLIVQQNQFYVSFLLPLTVEMPATLIEWARSFQVDCLRHHDRFQAS